MNGTFTRWDAAEHLRMPSDTSRSVSWSGLIQTVLFGTVIALS